MTDPLFGSVSPPWPAIPPQVYGYVQSPMAASHRFGTIAPVMAAQGSALVGPNPLSADPQAFGGAPGGANFPGFAAVVSSPLASGVPAFMGAEIAIGVTAPALLTAVAMRRGQPLGPTTDQEIEDFIYDAFDLLPGTNDVEVRVEGGRAALTGSVAHKRLKRDLGELAWAIPALNDVQNNVTITARRRFRASREGEAPAVAAPEIGLIAGDHGRGSRCGTKGAASAVGQRSRASCHASIHPKVLSNDHFPVRRATSLTDYATFARAPPRPEGSRDRDRWSRRQGCARRGETAPRHHRGRGRR